MRKGTDEIIQKIISERELVLIEKGFRMGQLGFKFREELYER